MTMRLSRYYGMDIYTDGGRFLGKVQELVIDLERGEIARMLMEPLSSLSREEAKRIIKDRSVLYKNVKSVEDVVMVSKAGPSPALE